MKKDNTGLQNQSLLKVINLLAELVIFDSYEFNQFLKKLIKVITEVIPVDSYFIYFYDREKKILILVGSKKPHTEELGKIVLRKGEGITGWVAEHQQTVALEKQAYKDPRFKFFKQLPEDSYESFLSVPIIDKSGVVGVVNLQNEKSMGFSKQQISIIESLVKIISSAFVKVMLERKVGELKDQLEERKIVEKAKGILMKVKNLDESEAYKFLRDESMIKRKPMKEVAEAVLMVLS